MEPIKITGTLLPIVGIDTSLPPEYIDGAPDLQNVEVDRGTLIKRYGLSELGVTVSGAYPIQAGIEFRAGDQNHVLRIAQNAIEKWNSGAQDWDSILTSGTVSLPLNFTEADEVVIATPFDGGQRIAVITTGADELLKYDGGTEVELLGGSPPKAKYAISFGAHLVLAHITDEGGNAYPNRVWWSRAGFPEQWDAVTTNAGFNTLTAGGDITGLGIFGNYLAVHKQEVLYLGYAASSPAILFDAKYTPGTIAHNTIRMLPNGLMAYLAVDGIRFFNGGTSKLVDSTINLDIRQQLNLAYAYTAWGIVYQDVDEYWCAIPLGDEQVPTTIFRVNYKTGQIHKHVMTASRCAFYFKNTLELTWDQYVGLWDNATGRWNDGAGGSGFPNLVIGSNDGKTLKFDKAAADDDGVAIDAFYETKDFMNEHKGQFSRWKRMELWAKGESVLISYSTDSGETWYDIEDVELDAEYPIDSTPIMIYFDVLSTKIRFRFKHDKLVGGFQLKQFLLYHTPREKRGV